jgi:two-component system LytT family response regulator
MAEEKGLSLTFVGYPSLKALQHSLEVGKDGPDIVILDVDAPHEGGAEGALKLRSLGYEGILVFLSRDERYALPAFDARAFNYALKGDDGDDARLRRIIAEAVALARARRRRRILLNGISEHRNAPLDEIAWFEVDRHVCCAHFVDGGSFEFLSSLDAVEDKLAAFGFVRAHRTCLVNVRQIASVRFGRLTLLDGTELPVGRSKQALVREAFGKAMGSAADGGVAVVALHEES